MTGRFQQGAMLIELMVGLVIGLLTSIAIVQVMSVAEGQRRSTMSGEDAQVSGTVALHEMQRDIRQAGYGLGVNQAAWGCPLKGANYGSSALPDRISPVVITDGAEDGNNGFASDSIAVFSSTKKGVAVPLLVSGDHLNTDTDPAFVVNSAFSVSTGDYMVAVPAAWVDGSKWCTVFQNTALESSSGVACVTPDSSAATGTNCTRVVHAASLEASYFPATGYPANSYLIDLGSTIRYRTYSLSNNILQVTELGASAKDAYPEVVNLQAFYAKDTDSDGVVDTYDTTLPTTAAGWKQVLGIRVALVTRSTQYEKELVTTTPPQWDLGTAISLGATTTDCSSGSGGNCLRLKINQLTDWQHYRYKVFDTMIPLRNILWNS